MTHPTHLTTRPGLLFLWCEKETSEKGKVIKTSHNPVLFTPTLP